jgi:hypothetical protein
MNLSVCVGDDDECWLVMMTLLMTLLNTLFYVFLRFSRFWRRDFLLSSVLASRFPAFWRSGVAISRFLAFRRRDFSFSGVLASGVAWRSGVGRCFQW